MLIFVPCGYSNINLRLGKSYVDFYIDNYHFLVKGINFLNAGINNNEMCICLVEPDLRGEILKNLTILTNDNQVSFSNISKSKQDINTEFFKNYFIKQVQAARSAGYNNVRFLSKASYILSEEVNLLKVLKKRAMIKEAIKNLPVVNLCLFNYFKFKDIIPELIDIEKEDAILINAAEGENSEMNNYKLEEIILKLKEEMEEAYLSEGVTDKVLKISQGIDKLIYTIIRNDVIFNKNISLK